MGAVSFEVTVTNGIDQERLARIQQTNLPTLEIDLREACGRVGMSELANIVVEGLEVKRWVHFPGIQDRASALGEGVIAASSAKQERLSREIASSFVKRSATANSELDWTQGEVPAGREKQVREQIKRYGNGNFRLYAPPIDYGRVLNEARLAREQGISFNEKLTQWMDKFNFNLSDPRPILDVLRAAGLVSKKRG